MQVQSMHSSKGTFISPTHFHPKVPHQYEANISQGFLWKYFGVAQPASDHPRRTISVHLPLTNWHSRQVDVNKTQTE